MLKDDKLMLESILDLKDREVDEVMIHRKDIFSLNIKLSRKRIIRKLKKQIFLDCQFGIKIQKILLE